MCDKEHGTGSAASAKAQLDWSCAYKAEAGILQSRCCKDATRGMIRDVCKLCEALPSATLN